MSKELNIFSFVIRAHIYIHTHKDLTKWLWFLTGGRCGVFLSIDANIELAEKQNQLDVYGYLQKMRRARQQLMETLDQYKFVYDTLEEYAICGSTYFPVGEISMRIKQKSVKNPFTKLNDYQHEYSIICKQATKFSIGDCAGGEWQWILIFPLSYETRALCDIH